MLIWNRQSVPNQVGKGLLCLAELVMRKITSPERKTVNVTQWCKREECWVEVKKINMRLPDELENCLITTEEEKNVQHNAKNDQKITNEIYAQTEVVNYPADVWKRLAEFSVSNHMASPTDISALTMACRIPEKIPTPYQCKRLLVLLNRAKEEGFSVN